MSLTFAILDQILDHQGKQDIKEGFVQYFEIYHDAFEVNTLLRMAHFIAQCCTESDHMKSLVEYSSGAQYQGELWNTNPGDGIRFKGRGYIQLTGRYNYLTYGKYIHLDLIAYPEKAAEPDTAVQLALEFWIQHDLNSLADQDNLVAITKKINGGLRAFDTRKIYLERTKQLLGGEPSGI